MKEYLKTVWAYMLENGRETNGKWSYYAGGYENARLEKWDYDYHADLLKLVKEIGVDWEKTLEPTSNIERAFTDTFHDSAECETLLGTLVLKDGREFLIGCHDEDGMGSYISNYMRYVKDKARVSSIFGESDA